MPGVNVNLNNAPTFPSRPSATGKLFVPLSTERGPAGAPVAIHSPGEFLATYGGVQTGSYGYVGQEAFFQEGGTTLYVQRITGGTTAVAKITGGLKTGGSTECLSVAAKSFGTWGNKISIEIVTESANYGIKVFETVGGVATLVEEVKGLATPEAGAIWSEGSKYVTLVKVAAGNPEVLAAKILSGGLDGTIVATNYKTALELFNKELGCGQVALCGVSGVTECEALMEHASINNRFALLDLPVRASGESIATYIAAIKTQLTTLGTKVGARKSAAFSTWANIPGLVYGTVRVSPWSMTQAGIIARNDASAEPPPVNEAAAGLNGQPRYVTSLASEYNRTQREELNNARCNAVRNTPGIGLETYGNVTVLSGTTEPAWLNITSARLFMYVVSEGEQILERYVFEEIDPHKLLFGRVGGALQAFMESLKDQLFNNPREAVNTSSTVNTPETIARNELVAAIQVQPSPTAETVVLNVTAIAA